MSVLVVEGVGRKSGLWPHSYKTEVSKGDSGAPWHTALFARCSVLYLLARLAENRGCCGLDTPVLNTEAAGGCL